jgi:hypothetical protein
MTLHQDLLDQANHLAIYESGKPKQAALRRAVSAAYYSMFHLLVSEGTAILGSKIGAPARAKLRRSFAHADMKIVCVTYVKATTAANFNDQIAPLLSFPIAPEIKRVALAFMELQELRHLADYDLSVKFNRYQTMSLVKQVEAAFADWQAVRDSPNAKIFAVDLLLRKSWSRT